MLQKLRNRELVSRLTREEEARSLGHPDPERATQGEVNLLSLYASRACRELARKEAERILHIAEFDADFNDALRNS